ncbi:MAG: extracellular solute-binding protein [Oscillospiraceae bacterium]|nr:extracellular solute-binding protein [Oscillospiraceae bacterium]
MKSKRLLVLILAACMLFAIMAACATDDQSSGGSGDSSSGGSGGSGDSSSGGGGSEPVELRVLNYFSLVNPGALEELERVWETFENEHPNIKIVREDEFEEPFHHAVEAYASAGTLPDVMYCWPSGRSTTLHTQRLLKDLGPLVARDGIAKDYSPIALDPAAQGGGYLAMIPRGLTATNAFYVNTEVLDAVGLTPAKTYSELVAQVPVLREAGYDTVLMANEATWVMQSCLFSAVVGRFMGEGWDQRILSGETDFNDPDFVAALNFIKTMYDDGVLNQSTLAVDYGSVAGLFASNTAAYLIDGDWKVGDFLTDNTTGVALIDPAKQGGIIMTVFPEIDVPGVKFNRSNSVVLATGWGINADIPDGSDKLEAAWTLVKWLVGNETLTFLIETGGIATPSRVDIDFASMDLEPLQVTATKFGDEYDKATVVFDGAFEGPIYTPLNDGLQALGLGTQTPEQVAQITQDAFEAWKAQ